jgi:hypothetical protein
MHRSTSTGNQTNADHLTVDLQNEALRSVGSSYLLHWSDSNMWEVFSAVKTQADKDRKEKRRAKRRDKKREMQRRGGRRRDGDDDDGEQGASGGGGNGKQVAGGGGGFGRGGDIVAGGNGGTKYGSGGNGGEAYTSRRHRREASATKVSGKEQRLGSSSRPSDKEIPRRRRPDMASQAKSGGPGSQSSRTHLLTLKPGSAGTARAPKTRPPLSSGMASRASSSARELREDLGRMAIGGNCKEIDRPNNQSQHHKDPRVERSIRRW